MIKKILIILPVLASIFFVSCKDDDTLKVFSISPFTIEFGYKGDSSYVSVYGDKENWELYVGETARSWCSFNKEGTLFVKEGKGRTEAMLIYSKPNNTRLKYTDSLYLVDKSGKYPPAYVKIILSPMAIKLATADTINYVASNVEQLVLDVENNVDEINFKSAPSWIRPSKEMFKEGKLSFDIDNNRSLAPRTGEVVIEGIWTKDVEKSIELKIQFIQDGISSRAIDSLSLTYMYNAFDGANWSDKWNLSEPMSTWKGVELNSVETSLGLERRVTAINLNGRSLKGVIPSEIADMPYLAAIRLQNNDISGEIPIELSNLPYLEILWLGDNKITGELSSSISNITTLKNISIINCKLSGTIPSSLSKLEGLVSLELRGNNFTGSMPSEIGTMKNLKVLIVNGNKLTGSLPATYKSNPNWYVWNPSVNILPQQDGVILQ